MRMRSFWRRFSHHRAGVVGRLLRAGADRRHAGASGSLPGPDPHAITQRGRCWRRRIDHPLGTDELGRDVLLGIAARHRVSLSGRLCRGARRHGDRRPGRRGGRLLRRLARPAVHAHLRDLPGRAELHPGGRDRRPVGHRACRRWWPSSRCWPGRRWRASCAAR